MVFEFLRGQFVRGIRVMSTPPTRKLWSGWSLTPRKSDEKGKGLEFVENSRKSLDGEDSGSINLQEKIAKLETEVSVLLHPRVY